MLAHILIFFAFILELTVALGTVFGLKFVDDMVAKKTVELNKVSDEIVQSIKEIRKLLKKINKIINLMKEERIIKIRKIIGQAIDFVNILMMFKSGKSKEKIGKFVGLKLIKAVLLGLKIYNA